MCDLYPSHLSSSAHLARALRVRNRSDIEKKINFSLFPKDAAYLGGDQQEVVAENIKSGRRFVVQNNVDQDLANAVCPSQSKSTPGECQERDERLNVRVQDN